MTEESNQKEQVICNDCGHRTWHTVVSSHILTSSAYDGFGGDDYLGESVARWDLLQCNGCGSINLRATLLDEEFKNLDSIFYPERTLDRHAAKYYVHLPDNLTHLYYEVSNTFNQNNLLLCTAGLRALLEGICVDKGILEGPNKKGKITNSLEGKINSLTSIVPTGIVKNLHGLRFLGNQALHELETPNKTDVKLAINIIEDIMNIIYELDYRAQLLMTKTQKKVRKNNA